MTKQTIAYFGYGSLVNLASLRTPYISAHRARLSGWRRCWLARPAVAGSFAPIEKLAFLSVERSKNTTVEGLVITDHAKSLPELDKREALYDRVSLDRQTIEFLDGDAPEISNCFLYEAQQPPATSVQYILRSYLDVVMQGYLEKFGEQGVRAFVETTGNFDLPLLEDRAAPYYPRAITLSPQEQALFDDMFPPQD